MSDSGAKERSGFSNFIYNPAAGTWFTRTPSSWLKITLFYIIYYCGLTAFFAGMLAVFIYAFTDDTAPVLTGGYSVLPQNPGMGFRPMPNIEKTMITYNMQDDDTIAGYKSNFHYFLQPNKTDGVTPSDVNYLTGQDTSKHGKFRDCTPEEMGDPAKSSDKPCSYRVDEMVQVQKECILKGDYGYTEGQPCVIIKINKVFQFIPELKKDSEDFLQIECKGEHPADVDNIGAVEYYPKAGFDMKFFPYLNQDNYLSPLVFVKFRNPTLGVLIQVVCQPTNVKNIEQKKQSRGDGRVHFELMIDNFIPPKKN